jgi:hypothetical protein
MAALTTHYYLDILAKEAGMEAEPVGGDVEPALEKEVLLEGTGAHWEVTGEKTAMNKVRLTSSRAWVLTLRSSEFNLSAHPPQTPCLHPTSNSKFPLSTPRVLLGICPFHPPGC